MASRAQNMPIGLRIALTSFVVVWLIMAAFPFVWTLWGSFKVELDFFYAFIYVKVASEMLWNDRVVVEMSH